MELLTEEENHYTSSFLNRENPLTLEEIWASMDQAWEECQCDPQIMDDRIKSFYNHPVWLLNGLFIEQDSESLLNRTAFANYIQGLNPKRIADFGGGYGTLARMIGSKCPDAEVFIIEPHPHAAAIELAQQTPNVKYAPEFSGTYDVIVSTDVFEHVLDPLSLVQKTATFLKPGGTYLIANCFYPVIKCHLPAVFHFRWSWDIAMKRMNLTPGDYVAYGRAYKRSGDVITDNARKVEQKSKRLFFFIELFPGPLRKYVACLFF